MLAPLLRAKRQPKVRQDPIGALARVELPAYLAFETYAGYEQRGGLPLSTPRFERDGVWRGDRTGIDASIHPGAAGWNGAPGYIFPAIGRTLAAWRSTGARAARQFV